MTAEEYDDVVSFLKNHHPAEDAELIATLKPEEIRKLAAWPEGTAGPVMTTDYVAFSKEITIRQAINSIRLEGAIKQVVSVSRGFYCIYRHIFTCSQLFLLYSDSPVSRQLLMYGTLFSSSQLISASSEAPG